ncbi:MAG: reverse transcriptase domain-containing protein [Patescibacteria group bacterium]
MNQGDIGTAGGGLNSHNIFEEITNLENLFLAWREFKRGKSKKLDVQEFEFNLEDNLFQLHGELKSGTYKHAPYSGFYITDPKLRHIHKACVRDRVLHHAIFRVLYPVFDKLFIFDSYSCRLNKGTHRAVKRLWKFARSLSRNNLRDIYALKCDVQKFFDSVDHSILLELIRRRIQDSDAIWLLQKIVHSFKTKDSKGLPIGNITSQLFANIYLNELDCFVKHKLKIRYYLRYCDDFVILNANSHYLLDTVSRIQDFLNSKLKLSLHPNKVIIRKYNQGVDFLGYVVRPRCVTLRTKTKNRMLRKVSMKNLASYLGVLKHCAGYKLEKRVTDVVTII